MSSEDPLAVIRTTRLELRPHHPQHLLALIDGSDRYEQISGRKPADGLREFYVSGEISPQWLAHLRQGAGADPWTYGYAVVDCDSELVVGTGGFKGPADSDGMVEIGYGIVADFQRRGFATEVAAALVSFASQVEEVRQLRAHTLPEANASNRVLKKCGFEFVGEVIDPEDGPVWRWERPAETI